LNVFSRRSKVRKAREECKRSVEDSERIMKVEYQKSETDSGTKRFRCQQHPISMGTGEVLVGKADSNHLVGSLEGKS